MTCLHRTLSGLAAVAGVMLLASCGATHEQVMKNRVLRVGVCPDYPPIIYKEGGDGVRGIEADLAAYVGEQLPATVRFVEMPFDDLIPRLKKGDIDVIMSGMSDAEARRIEVRFVPPYMSIGQMALVRAKDAVSTNLYNAKIRVGCLAKTTGELFVKQHMPKAELVTCRDPAEAVEALKGRKIDVYIDDAPFVLYATKEHPQLEAVPWLLTDEHLAWAVPRDKSYDFLYEELAKIVLRAQQRGDIRRIVNRYIEIQVRVK